VPLGSAVELCGQGAACVGIAGKASHASVDSGRVGAASAVWRYSVLVAETARVPQRAAGRVAGRGIPSGAPPLGARWHDRGVEVAALLPDGPAAADRVYSST